MTTITALPTPWTLLHAAIEGRQPMEISYHGRPRIVCPHALGWKAGRGLMLAYQTSTTGPPADPRTQWRCFYVDEIELVVAAEHAGAWETAENYNPTQPFPTIDQLSIAISPPTATRPVR